MFRCSHCCRAFTRLGRKGLGAGISLLLSLVIMIAAALPARAADSEKVLRLYIWSEYIDPQIPKDFEKETGIKVQIDLYESNEDMMAKLQAGGDSQYDLVVPSNFAVPVMANLKLLQPLDHAKIPNMKNLLPKFVSPAFDPGNKYSTAYQYGTVGLMYRKDKLPNFQPTWKLIFDDKTPSGPYVLIDSIREMMGIGLIYLGKDVNTTSQEDIKDVAKLLLQSKKNTNFVGFEGGVGGKNKVSAGTAAMALVYNGDAVRAMSEDKNIAFVNPKEGTVMWVDSFCIPAKAPHADAAHKFINYILDGKVGARVSNFNHFATPNAAAVPFITSEDVKNPAIYPSVEEMKKMPFINDVGNNTKLYNEAWTMIKSR